MNFVCIKTKQIMNIITSFEISQITDQLTRITQYSAIPIDLMSDQNLVSACGTNSSYSLSGLTYLLLYKKLTLTKTSSKTIKI